MLHVLWLIKASGGSRGGAWGLRFRAPPYFGLKKKKKSIAEGRKAGRANDEKTPLPPQWQIIDYLK